MEIEKKWLLADDTWKNLVTDKEEIVQFYLTNTKEKIERIRIVNNEKAIKTIKGASIIDSKGFLARPEENIDFNLEEALELLQKVDLYISKDRFIVECFGLKFEVDLFNNLTKDVKMVELEITTDEDYQKYLKFKENLPSWVGQDVTEDFSYSNNNLLQLAKRNKPKI